MKRHFPHEPDQSLAAVSWYEVRPKKILEDFTSVAVETKMRFWNKGYIFLSTPMVRYPFLNPPPIK